MGKVADSELNSYWFESSSERFYSVGGRTYFPVRNNYPLIFKKGKCMSQKDEAIFWEKYKSQLIHFYYYKYPMNKIHGNYTLYVY